MKTDITLFSFAFPAAFVAALVVLSSSSADMKQAPAPDSQSAFEQTDAERMFADAPFGVDPIVTGPSTPAFRQQQKVAGCDAAQWPHIPTICYPG